MYFYGLNPSGGVHRYDDETGELTLFTTPSNSRDVVTQTCRWVRVEFDRYNGWVDWVPFTTLPVEVQQLELEQVRPLLTIRVQR